MLFGLGAVAAVGYVVMAWGSRSTRGQPIAFDHQKHAANNVPCSFCHRYYTELAVAGMPGTKVCARCHEDVIYLTPEKEKLRAYVESGREIPWERVYRVHDYTFFSHRRHVVLEKIQCSKCHGEVATFTEPITKQAIELTMDACLDCHKENKATTDCVSCHR